MSRLLILYNYNKYYNRIIKRLATFNDYLALITPGENTPAQYRGFIRENMNFDYQDGVYAQHVINIAGTDPQYAKIEHPDYCILEESYTEGTGEDAVTTTKLSRYFILDVTKVMGNQFQYSLRRDLLADYYDNIMYAPVFIEKGWVSTVDSPLLFNKESMTYNQIKQGEILLNQTKLSGKGKGWVVGYIASEDGDNPTPISDCVAQVEAPEVTQQWNDLSSILKNIINAGEFDEYDPYQLYAYVYIKVPGLSDPPTWRGELSHTSTYGTNSDITPYGIDMTGAMLNSFLSSRTAVKNALKNGYVDDMLYSLNSVFNSANPDVYNGQNDYYNSLNNLIYQKDGKLYRVTVTKQQVLVKWEKNYTASEVSSGSDTLSTQARIYINYLKNTDVFSERNATANQNAIQFIKFIQHYDVNVVQVAYNEIKCDIPANRNKNADAPYDVFCIPIGEIDVVNGSSPVITTKANLALPMARAIATKGTTDRIYDIQILPYCPFDEIITSDGDIDIAGFTEHTDYEYIKNTVSGVTSNVGIIVFPKTCKGTFDITLSTSEPLIDYLIEDRSEVIEKKIKAETQVARFVSPNFASQFEINVQKNKGITDINVDYYYKPYSPYIHVAPYFNGLYGQDFNDPKGLICAGDFSISSSSSQWEKYQIENKNFELIFNRQIQNLDVNNSIAYEQAAIASGIGVGTSVLTGIGAGAASGAMVGSLAGPVGSLVGGIAGAVVGGVGGGVLSGVGRKYDLEYLKKSQSEARSYAVDMYAYNLGNIKALPYTLTKVTTITPNNKVFPFIEIYDCTSVEKEALRDKLLYNGMTIMRISTIHEHKGTTGKHYVQGQLIRLVGIDEDSHVVAEIAQEIKEGAYYYGYDSE